MVKSFWLDYELRLELHTLTQAICSYALLLRICMPGTHLVDSNSELWTLLACSYHFVTCRWPCSLHCCSSVCNILTYCSRAVWLVLLTHYQKKQGRKCKINICLPCSLNYLTCLVPWSIEDGVVLQFGDSQCVWVKGHKTSLCSAQPRNAKPEMWGGKKHSNMSSHSPWHHSPYVIILVLCSILWWIYYMTSLRAETAYVHDSTCVYSWC